MRIIERTKDISIKLWKDESGASLLEYAVLVGLITAAAVTTIGELGTWVKDQFQHVLDIVSPPAP